MPYGDAATVVKSMIKCARGASTRDRRSVQALARLKRLPLRSAHVSAGGGGARGPVRHNRRSVTAHESPAGRVGSAGLDSLRPLPPTGGLVALGGVEVSAHAVMPRINETWA